MTKSNVIDLAGREEDKDPLTALLRTGARTLIQKAVEAELKEVLESHRDRRLEDGRAGVVRERVPRESARECRGQVLRFAPAWPFRCNRLILSRLN